MNWVLDLIFVPFIISLLGFFLIEFLCVFSCPS